MNKRVWQFVMGVVIAVFTLLATVEFVAPVQSVITGTPTREFARGALHWRIERIDPTSPAGLAGIVVGDTVELQNPYADYRRGTPALDTPLHYRVTHLGVSRVMGLFPRAADDAVRAAIALLDEVKRYNRGRKRAGYTPIKVGVGLHTGALMLGTIGENERMDTTVISDAVNLASRLEGVTKQFRSPLIVSAATLDRLKDHEEYHIRPLGSLGVIGKQQEVAVFEIFDAEEPDLVAHKIATRDAFARALASYRSGDFGSARAGFAAIVEAHGGDGPAHYYAERCNEHLIDTRELRWDGVERLITK